VISKVSRDNDISREAKIALELLRMTVTHYWFLLIKEDSTKKRCYS